MTDTTTRFNITEPSADRHDAADIPLYVRNVAQAVESSGAKYGQGTNATKPAASAANQGMFYFATDQSKLYYCDGAGWTDVTALAALSVGTAQLQDHAVTEIKLALLSVGTPELIDAAVTLAKIGALAVDATKIANSLKPSAGAGGSTEALRALGTGAGQAASGSHAAQHAAGGADPLVVTVGMLDATVTALLPQPGDVKMVAYDVVAGVNEPAGWLLEDGRVRAQATDAALFAKIGSTWNTGGEGVGNYRLPDSRSRSPMGKGQGAGLTLRNVGSIFGEELHVTSIGEMPSHQHGGGNHAHGYTDPGHAHGASTSVEYAFDASSGGGVSKANAVWGTATANVRFTNGVVVGGAFVGITISNSGAVIAFEGGGAGHNTVHPCFVHAFLVKT